MSLNITALFCCFDDFAKLFEHWEKHRLLPSPESGNGDDPVN